MTQGDLNRYQKWWASEKYLVMAHSQAHYNALRLLFKGNQWSEEKELEFERLLKEAYQQTPTTKTLRTAYQHIWGYFKKKATSHEKDRYKERHAPIFEGSNSNIPTCLSGSEPDYAAG